MLHSCRLRLFLDWGIRFGKPYEVPEKVQRPVAYADKRELERAILRQYPRSEKAVETARRNGGITDSPCHEETEQQSTQRSGTVRIG